VKFIVQKKVKWAHIDYDLFSDCKKLKPAALKELQDLYEKYQQRLRAERVLKGGVSLPQAGCGRVKVLKRDADAMAATFRRTLSDPSNLIDAV